MFSGLAGLARFRAPTGGQAGLFGTFNYSYPGSYPAPPRMLPGGYIQAAPTNRGLPQSTLGVPFPVVGYPDTGWDPGNRLTGPYANSLGLWQGGGIIADGGGAGGPMPMPYDPMGYGTRAPNENVMPPLTTTLYPTPGGDWVTQATNTDNLGNPITGPNLSGAPPVTAYPNPATAYGNRTPAGNWAQNARSNIWAANARAGYQPWQRAAVTAATNLGFGTGLAGIGPLGGATPGAVVLGGFTGSTPLFSYSGFGGPVGRSSAGPLQP